MEEPWQGLGRRQESGQVRSCGTLRLVFLLVPCRRLINWRIQTEALWTRWHRDMLETEAVGVEIYK